MFLSMANLHPISMICINCIYCCVLSSQQFSGCGEEGVGGKRFGQEEVGAGLENFLPDAGGWLATDGEDFGSFQRFVAPYSLAHAKSVQAGEKDVENNQGWLK